MGSENENSRKIFSRKVKDKADWKLYAQNETKKSAWSGLGLFGVVGWSVVTPTLAGTALGIWMDKRYHQSFSWTLSFLIIGLLVGCLTAWRAIRSENNSRQQKQEKK
ncbi:MAG: AtpZ/AtpI family protein [Taibaiella sp.]|nr:AtpZ/AtpI family protein [Taibaiella sp.]